MKTMSNIRFSCTSLAGTQKQGIIPKDANGYYDMVIGGLDILNSAGEYYDHAGAKELFQESSSFMRRVKRGALRGEVGHPRREHGQSIDEDRFPRPCFPRKDGDALVKINDRIFNNSEIDNMKALQHSGSPPQDLSMPWIWDRSTGTSSGVFRMMRTVSSPARVPMMTSFLEWSMAKATEEAEPGMV